MLMELTNGGHMLTKKLGWTVAGLRSAKGWAPTQSCEGIMFPGFSSASFVRAIPRYLVNGLSSFDMKLTWNIP